MFHIAECLGFRVTQHKMCTGGEAGTGILCTLPDALSPQNPLTPLLLGLFSTVCVLWWVLSPQVIQTHQLTPACSVPMNSIVHQGPAAAKLLKAKGTENFIQPGADVSQLLAVGIVRASWYVLVPSP